MPFTVTTLRRIGAVATGVFAAGMILQFGRNVGLISTAREGFNA